MATQSIDSKVPRIGFSAAEAAVQIGVSETTIWNLIRSGDIAVVRIGRRTIIPQFVITEYMRAKATRKVPAK